MFDDRRVAVIELKVSMVSIFRSDTEKNPWFLAFLGNSLAHTGWVGPVWVLFV